VAAFRPVRLTTLTLAALVEAPKFCKRTEAVEVGIAETPDWGSTGYAAQYTVPLDASTAVTCREVFAPATDLVTKAGEGSASLKLTASRRSEDATGAPLVQEALTHGAIV
jgi:hypothetical protein